MFILGGQFNNNGCSRAGFIYSDAMLSHEGTYTFAYRSIISFIKYMVGRYAIVYRIWFAVGGDNV